ncbi:hypothetical protein E2C01_101627 [Portunus trituberculatus]|uniref:Uncharacterized protein n=1 Tax=Portunus trituberculatus TaxID=210409 RepID=A0A5B7KKK7_PORTR|nr:hypothetical protein [Portunus trituberculatus]
MNVNARSYRWSESRSKVCQMCDSGEDETVEHVMLECVKYARDRYEMMQVVLRELGDARVEKTGREWMELRILRPQEKFWDTCRIKIKIKIKHITG